MNDKPNPEDFSADERPGEYRVRFHVRGTIETTIDASSLEEARAKAEAMVEDEDSCLELDSADDVDIAYVHREPKRYRMIRGGKKIQATWLEPGDLPREPDEHGF